MRDPDDVVVLYYTGHADEVNGEAPALDRQHGGRRSRARWKRGTSPSS